MLILRKTVRKKEDAHAAQAAADAKDYLFKVSKRVSKSVKKVTLPRRLTHSLTYGLLTFLSKVFDALGTEDPLAKAGRRRLANILLV